MSSSTRSKPQRTWFHRLLLIVVGIVTVGGVLGFLILSFGQVSGTEFTPYRFNRRGFAYYRIPLIRLQISPVVRWDTTNDLEKHLSSKKVIPGLLPMPKRWDVVEVGSTEGDAAILCNYLDTKNDSDKFRWLVWTQDNPQLAVPFWKAVHQAATLKAYFFVPELFALAEAHDDATQLSQEIDRLMVSQLASLADDFVATEQFELADRFYAAALYYDADDASVRKKHAEIQKRLGKSPETTATAEIESSDQHDLP